MKTIFTVAIIFLYGFAVDPCFAQTPFYQDKTITWFSAGRRPVRRNCERAGDQYSAQTYPGKSDHRHADTWARAAADKRPITSTASSSPTADRRQHGCGAGDQRGPRRDRACNTISTNSFISALPTARSSTYSLPTATRDLNTLEKLRSTPGVRIGGQSVGHPVYITGRVFAYILGLKEPKFVVGFTGPKSIWPSRSGKRREGEYRRYDVAPQPRVAG